MTTQAQNVNIQRVLESPYVVTRRDGQETHGTHDVRAMVERLQRPASSTSPRRSDGTRAPKAWSSLGWVGDAGRVRHSWLDTQGTEYRYPLGHQSLIACPIRETYGHDIRATEIATNKMLENLKDQKIDLGTTLSQIRSTVQLVTGVANDINGQLGRFQRNRSKEWKRVAKRGFNNSSGRYLEMVYGWKPMISDIESACDEVANQLYRGAGLQLTARGSGSQKRYEAGPTSGAGGVTRTSKVEVTSKAYVSATMYVPNWVLHDFSRLGLTNPFVVGWENAPYSHVVDWMVPVGNWLSLFDSATFLRFKEGSRSVITRGKYQFEYDLDRTPWAKDVKYLVERKPRGDCWRFDRFVLQSLPSAYFPRLRNPLSLNHMAEALTMLVQKFRKPMSRVNIRF